MQSYVYPGESCYQLVTPCGADVRSERLRHLLRIAPEFPGCSVIEWHRDGAGVLHLSPDPNPPLWAVSPQEAKQMTMSNQL